jgi:hypothetical protein
MRPVADKPSGSVIRETEEWDGLLLWWPWPRGGWFRIFPMVFLPIWLMGWAAGVVAVVNRLITHGLDLFLCIWLAGWAVGGVFVMAALWFLMRPSRPESVFLGETEFRYNPGRSPANMLLEQGMMGMYAIPFRYGTAPAAFRRKPLTMPKAEMGKFVLDRAGERQRLTFDHGAERIEIGTFLREPEREWLFDVLGTWRTT